MTTTVPSVADALLTAFRAIDDSRLEIQDGPKPKASQPKVIAVGVGNEAVTHRSVPANSVGGWLYDEQYQIICSLWSWSGTKSDAKMAECRAEAGALLDQVKAAVIAVNGALNLAQIRLGPDLSWLQSYAGEGLACSVGFTVEVTAVGV